MTTKDFWAKWGEEQRDTDLQEALEVLSDVLAILETIESELQKLKEPNE